MATSLTVAQNNLKRARADLARCEARKSPAWYVQMFRVEVECCENELRVWKEMAAGA